LGIKVKLYRTVTLENEQLQEHYDWLMSIPIAQQIFEDMESSGIPRPNWQRLHAAYFKTGYLVIITEVPCEEEEIFKRFAQVFDLTYTRFLDLQKAEAQARESEIQLALERVRARTMAMHKSDELSQTAAVLFEQLQVLGNTPERINLGIFKEESGTIEWWITTQEGHQISTNFFTKFEDHFVFPTMLNAWKAKEKSTVISLSGVAVTDWVRYITQQIGMPVNPGLVKEKRIISCAFFSQGLIGTTTSEPLSPGIIHLLERFASVFEQAYTRFLDLQRAEKQARESQIEAALEKVRSRSLAMQSPDELIEVAQLLREEMGALGVEELETSSIYLHDENSEQTQCWFTIKDSEHPEKSVSDQFSLELQDTWVGRKMLDFYSSSEDRTSILMQGENRIEWIRYCEGKTDLFGTSNFYGDAIPERTYHLYKFSNGYIGAAAPGEISSESWDLLRRATAVFSFAYTRFQDLQKAEASARAAMRQASLDRIRADISSMRHTDDLDRITPLIFKELTVLGVPFIRCGVFIIQEKQELVEAYLSSPEGNSLGVLRLPYQASELTFQTVEAWRKGAIYRQHWKKEDFIQWINQLMEQDQIQDSRTYQGSAAPPESLDLHFVPFTQGMLYVGSLNPLDEKELELVQALAKAFSIAYARYEDFVKLEQAKAEVESAMKELKSTQNQLIQQEKLASLGQLTAGIAHEIKNPLNFVNNFSEVSIELVDEAIEERNKNPEVRDETLVDEILEDIKSNLQKVHEHGSRANGIVTSMLQHSRGGTGKMEPTDLNALIKEYVNLSFHGMRAGKNPIDVEIALDLDPELGDVPLIKEDFTRVIINLCNNAFDAMRGKTLQGFRTLGGLEAYHPQLTVRTKTENDHILIEVADNGPGIPDEIKDKILQPFFTTKKGTEGTGLGLSITHDIVKAHGGELRVESREGSGATFHLFLFPG
jgi:signal transduction histidine kinase